MSDRTAIEWAANADGTPGATWNPIRARNRETGKVGWFCVHASDGCRFCYAEAINRRLGTGVDYKAQNAEAVEVFLDERTLTQPLRWKKPRVVFVCSMTDLFGEFVDDAFIDRVFAVMAICPQHIFIVLTKRSARMRTYLESLPNIGEPDRITEIACEIGWSQRGYEGNAGLVPRPLPNVWLGISCEDQPRADKRIPDLLATPAAVRFISAEPLLGPIDLWGGWVHGAPRLDWVIVGGESGQNARPMHPDWARALRDQCAAAGVAYFFKQWGEWREVDGPKTSVENRAMGSGTHWLTRDGALHSDGSRSFSIYHDYRVKRFGKRAAGRLLDGVEHNQRPQLTQEQFS